MPYVAIPASGGSAALTALTGLTDKQVVFGSATGTGTSSADLTYDDTTNDLALSVSESGGTVGGLVANTSNTASSAAQFKVQVAGGTAANPSIMLSISGVKTYDWRIDNANNDRLDLYFDSTRILSFREDSGTLLHVTTALEEKFLYENTATALYTHFKCKASSRLFEIYTFGSTYGSSPFFGLTGANSCSIISDAETLAFGTTSAKPVVFGTNNIEKARIDSAGNFVQGTAAIAANATDGFLYVASCAGPPTGTPTAYAGRVPIVVDTTNHKLYFYDGSWRDAGP